MKIFVTGGTGFIGSHFLARIPSGDVSVRALRRGGHGAKIPLVREPEWVTSGLADCPMEVLMGCDVLVHLAARGVSPQVAPPAELMRDNVADAVALWTKAIDAGVTRLVICGSCFEYGASAAGYDRIPTSAALSPVEPYGASKAAATMAALGLCRSRGCELVVLRPFHCYGEGQHTANFWPSLRKAALAGEDYAMTYGEQVRDFSPVEAVADAFWAACFRKDVNFARPVIENIGSGVPVTLADFASGWWTKWNAKGALRLGAIPYRKNEVMRFVPALCISHKP
jgi:UDP-glucose 4-epimerase